MEDAVRALGVDRGPAWRALSASFLLAALIVSCAWSVLALRQRLRQAEPVKKIIGIVQEHMFHKDDIRRLEAGLRQIYRTHYATERAVVLWMVMPKGYAYAERKPSDAIIVMAEVDEDITQDKREELMCRFSTFLLDNFQVSPLDSLITVANSSFVNAFFDAQRKRIDPAHRLRINLKLYGTALLTRLHSGYLRLPVKLT